MFLYKSLCLYKILCMYVCFCISLSIINDQIIPISVAMFLQIEPKTNKQPNEQLKPKSIKSLLFLTYCIVCFNIYLPNKTSQSVQCS